MSPSFAVSLIHGAICKLSVMVSDVWVALLLYGEGGLLLLSSGIVHTIQNDTALVFSHFHVFP